MLIDRVHKTVRLLANTDGRGNVKRENIDLTIHNVVLEMFEESLFDVNRMMNRQNKGLVNSGIENVTNKVREKILYYLQDETVSKTDTYFVMPSEVRYFDELLFNDIQIELCKNTLDFTLNKKNATEEYPIAIKKSNSIYVEPSTIESIQLSYLRNPVPAKWTYNIVDGLEVFNPSKNDFKDIDIHSSQEDDLIIRVLEKFGINLKESDLQKIASRETEDDFNEKITS